jgi:signal peptidase I
VENPFYVISSESMMSTLMVGDVVVLRNRPGSFSFSDLHVKDMIVFHTEDGGGRTIVHRAVEIYQGDNNGNGDRLVKTKDDAHPISYEVLDYPVRKHDYNGKVIFVISQLVLYSEH